MTRSGAEVLQRVFPGLSEEDLAELASASKLRTYPPDVVLCHEGRIEDTFFIILDGRVEVSKQLVGDAHRVLHRPGPGEFFGEMALVLKGPRTATVRTLEPTTVLEVDCSGFMNVLQRSASMAMRIMLQVMSRLRDSDQRAIADLHRKNIELTRTYAELHAQGRLRSEFLTNVAHELRTPLTSATGYLQLVNSGVVAPEQVSEFMETVARNLEIVVHLVNSILFLQEMELITPEFETLSVEEVVLRAVHEMVERAAHSGLTIDTRVEGRLPQVQGDAGSLSRAVAALLDNAIKFSPDGGEITVRVHTDDGTLRIDIRDPGVGFPMERLDDLFQPFTRVEVTGGYLFAGVGLGLPIAKYVVELHGGHIEVESQVGQGSSFTIVLPAARGATG